jgi:SAM-dependent MidA family methyltransferase
MVGRQMEEMWGLMGRPDRFQVVEMGAGMGYLAKDMLDYLNGVDGGGKEIFSHLDYTIVELNPSVKAKQQALLDDYRDRVRWVSDPGELGKISGCFLSNELLDAFPVRLVEMDDELMEIRVVAQGEDFVEVQKPCSREVAEYFREFGVELTKGCRTEVNLRIRDWLGKISDSLDEGFVLTIDYGYPSWDYYSAGRNTGTLLCYFQHTMSEDPYQHVGEQDITAHVNFSSVKNWGEEAGLKTIGFCPQGTYLVSLGIDEVIMELSGGKPEFFDTAKIKGLILPEGMGESHKVMIQYKGEGNPVLRGFSLRNQMRKL